MFNLWKPECCSLNHLSQHFYTVHFLQTHPTQKTSRNKSVLNWKPIWNVFRARKWEARHGIRAIPCESWGSVLDQIHDCYKHGSSHRARVPVPSTLVWGLLTKMQALDRIISTNSDAQLALQLERSTCPPPVVSATCFGRNNKIVFVCMPVCIA